MTVKRTCFRTIRHVQQVRAAGRVVGQLIHVMGDESAQHPPNCSVCFLACVCGFGTSRTVPSDSHWPGSPHLPWSLHVRQSLNTRQKSLVMCSVVCIPSGPPALFSLLLSRYPPDATLQSSGPVNRVFIPSSLPLMS